MSNCIFCSIVEGRIPAYVIYQDEFYLAIMDRYPSAKGHVLILPKRHVADVHGLNQAEAAALIPIAQKVSDKMRDTLRIAGLNLLQNNGKAAGQEIAHFHLHLIPRYENDGLKFAAKPTSPSEEELELLAGKLKL
ncbi:MAG: HIT family protein [Defluviitaleaceae bacterium]|nr:HIT family protein [Defluviitaleaceae bacterium]